MTVRNSLASRNISGMLPAPVWAGQLKSRLSLANVALNAGTAWMFELGILPGMPLYQQQNLRLINRAAFLGLLMALPGSFSLWLAGFDHPISLMVSALLVLLAILLLNALHKGALGQLAFAFTPALMIFGYGRLSAAAASTDPLIAILMQQGMGLALLLPVLLYGLERSKRGLVLAACVVLFLGYQLALGVGMNAALSSGNLQAGLVRLLSLAQYLGLAGCILYVQGYMLENERLLQQRNQKLQSLAMRDGLTRLFNRRFMEELIRDAINRAKRSGLPLSLVMIDVDHFKQINDALGHAAGDGVLRRLADLLEQHKRSTDYLARWGGDELVLLLTDTGLTGAGLVAEKLRGLVEASEQAGSGRISLSMGVSEYHAGEDATRFIARADQAMYRAKRSGRNRVESVG